MEFREPLLEEEQRELFKKLKETNDLGIRETLILHNLKLVYWVANKYFSTDKFEFDDLFQSGVIGLIKAIETYNPKLGTFGNYAVTVIRQAIFRDICNYGDVIRVSEYMLQEIRKLKAIRNKLAEVLEREPTPGELSIRMNKDITEVEEMLIIMQDTISLNLPIVGVEEGVTIQDTIRDDNPTPEEVIADKIFLEKIREEIKPKLSKLQYNLIVSYYGLDGPINSLKEIAEKEGDLKYEYVRQERDKALRIIRRTRYIQELNKEIDRRTSFIQGIDYGRERVNGGLNSSPVENIVLQREYLRKKILKEKG